MESVAGATNEAIGSVLIAKGVSTEYLRETVGKQLPGDQGDEGW